jgi:phage shock protein A
MIGGSLSDVLDTIAVNATVAVATVRKSIAEMQRQIDERDAKIKTLTDAIESLKKVAQP